MLVLSRKTDQQISFPNLGITISIMQIKGKLVKVGIDAPRDYTVVRSEVDSAETADVHRLRNEINRLQLGVQVLERRLAGGQQIDAQDAMDQILNRAQSVSQSLAESRSDALPARQPKKLLVVEDCDNERQLMAYLLAAEGFDVFLARDGNEALEQLRNYGWKPDFVLMDMQMPLFDGLSTLYEIRRDPELRDLRVFAVTGTGRSSELDLPEHGWDGWFSKPVDVRQLISRLHHPDYASCS